MAQFVGDHWCLTLTSTSSFRRLPVEERHQALLNYVHQLNVEETIQLRSLLQSFEVTFDPPSDLPACLIAGVVPTKAFRLYFRVITFVEGETLWFHTARLSFRPSFAGAEAELVKHLTASFKARPSIPRSHRAFDGKAPDEALRERL